MGAKKLGSRSGQRAKLRHSTVAKEASADPGVLELRWWLSVVAS